MGQSSNWTEEEQEALVRFMVKNPPLNVKGWERICDQFNKWNSENDFDERPLTGIKKKLAEIRGLVDKPPTGQATPPPKVKLYKKYMAAAEAKTRSRSAGLGTDPSREAAVHLREAIAAETKKRTAHLAKKAKGASVSDTGASGGSGAGGTGASSGSGGGATGRDDQDNGEEADSADKGEEDSAAADDDDNSDDDDEEDDDEEDDDEEVDDEEDDVADDDAADDDDDDELLASVLERTTPKRTKRVRNDDEDVLGTLRAGGSVDEALLAVTNGQPLKRPPPRKASKGVGMATAAVTGRQTPVVEGGRWTPLFDGASSEETTAAAAKAKPPAISGNTAATGVKTKPVAKSAGAAKSTTTGTTSKKKTARDVAAAAADDDDDEEDDDEEVAPPPQRQSMATALGSIAESTKAQLQHYEKDLKLQEATAQATDVRETRLVELKERVAAEARVREDRSEHHARERDARMAEVEEKRLRLDQDRFIAERESRLLEREAQQRVADLDRERWEFEREERKRAAEERAAALVRANAREDVDLTERKHRMDMQRDIMANTNMSMQEKLEVLRLLQM